MKESKAAQQRRLKLTLEAGGCALYKLDACGLWACQTGESEAANKEAEVFGTEEADYFCRLDEVAALMRRDTRAVAALIKAGRAYQEMADHPYGVLVSKRLSKAVAAANKLLERMEVCNHDAQAGVR